MQKYSNGEWREMTPKEVDEYKDGGKRDQKNISDHQRLEALEKGFLDMLRKKNGGVK